MQRLTISVTPSGTTGGASGNSTASVFYSGNLHAVYLDYYGSSASTCVRLSQGIAPSQNLLTVNSNSADGWYFPRSTLVTSVAGATSGNAPFPVTEKLVMSVGTSVPQVHTAYVYIQEQ
jgi:hypothetical protein